MLDPGWKKEYLDREAQFAPELGAEPRADEPPATEQPSVDCPHLMVLMPHSTWLAVVNANLALTADNERMEKCADAAAEDLGLLSLRVFDMRRKRNFWRWMAAGLGLALVLAAFIESFRS
jgi:hypothetical protein